MAERTRATAEERFLAKISRAEYGCWEWQGARTRDGYGTFWTGEHVMRRTRQPVMVLAHRWAYEHHIGSIAEGMNVCHSCDNPPCVNPAHLFEGTQRRNVHDCISKGRHRNGRAVLTESEEAEVRALYRGEYGDLVRLGERFGVTKKTIAGVVRDLPRSGRLRR